MKYLLTGGGTGGHVYPALAIKEIIVQKHPDAQFLYVGVKDKSEDFIISNLEGEQSIPMEYVTSRGLPRSVALFEFFRFCRDLLKGVLTSRKIIKRYNPDLIIATGGYVTAPVILAATLCNTPVIIHEQNSVPGLVNKSLSRFASAIMLTFEDSARFFSIGSPLVTGYPVRRSISLQAKDESRKQLDIPVDAEVVFVFGGSTGARVINDTIANSLDSLLRREKLVIIHGTGRDRPAIYNAYSTTKLHVEDRYKTEITEGRYIYKDYFLDIDTVYSAADIVVCRAGAGTVMECAMMKKPMLLIPKSGLPGDHQVKNAESALSIGGAVMLKEEIHNKQAIVDIEKFSTLINRLFDSPDELSSLAENAHKLINPSTAKLILDVANSAINGSDPSNRPGGTSADDKSEKQ